MRISKLKVENFKRIVCVDVEPGDGAVLVGGRNAQGKSSTLDAIAAALGGGKLSPSEPVRRGAESAAVEVVTDDGMRITRTWSSDGKSSIKIENADGLRVPQPQTWLDQRLGSMSFDPLAFSRLKPAEQANVLRALCGVDTREIEAEEASVFAARTDINRDGKALAARYAAMPHAPGAEPVDVAGLLSEQREALAAAARRDDELRGAKADEDKAESLYRMAESAAAEAVALRARADAAEATAERHRADAAGVEAAAARRKSAAEAIQVPDLDAIADRIAGADAANAAVRANAERERVGAELEEERAKSAALTRRLSELAERKAAMLAAAKMPIDGLGMSGDVVTFGGLPLEQASAAERLRVATAIGIAANPAMRVLLVRDGALLDDESLALMSSMAAEAGAQVWIEVVGDRGGIVIEDGAVRGAKEAT